MPDNRRIIYWDACCQLSYINEVPGRVLILEPLLASSSSASGTIKIHSSAIARVEVAFGATEKNRKVLDPDVESRIESLWTDPGAIESVEFHDGIGDFARQLMRQAIPQGWSLRALDAIHLGTAMWLCSIGIEVPEFHTYDKALPKYSGITGFDILEPYTLQPTLL